MAKAESINNSIVDSLNIEFMRSLVKQYSELGQWSSALFWADAAAAAGSGSSVSSGDDVWLLASAMLARGEYHRAAHTVTSRGLHRRHLLCLGVAMRAYLAAKDPASALNLLNECTPALLEQKNNDQTHNRALAGVLVWQARALSHLERREAAAETLASALRTDCACYEALELLLEQHSLTPKQEVELVESLPISTQLGAAEGALLRAAYRERLNRYAPSSAPAPAPPDTDCPVKLAAEAVRARTLTAGCMRVRRLAAAGLWREALAVLDGGNGNADAPWCCAHVRVACLVELKRSAQLFAFAHTLVDAYPDKWEAWFAVGCYYYLIGKSEFARRYLSKAKSLEPGAGCVWLAYGHSFAADNEHDQAMAAYFKASQLMAGCHLPPLYVGVECSLLNNVDSCEKFLLRAAQLHTDAQCEPEVVPEREDYMAGWRRLVQTVRCAHVAHEAGAAAYAADHLHAARALWMRAVAVATMDDTVEIDARWAPTLDGLGHVCRKLGHTKEALEWHRKSVTLRPARAATYTAIGLCLALLGHERDAADALHTALAKDPDDSVASSLLNIIMDKLDDELTEQELPKFPFFEVKLWTHPAPSTPAPLPDAPPAPEPAPGGDATNTSDMSMSFD